MQTAPLFDLRLSCLAVLVRVTILSAPFFLCVHFSAGLAPLINRLASPAEMIITTAPSLPVEFFSAFFWRLSSFGSAELLRLFAGTFFGREALDATWTSDTTDCVYNTVGPGSDASLLGVVPTRPCPGGFDLSLRVELFAGFVGALGDSFDLLDGTQKDSASSFTSGGWGAFVFFVGVHRLSIAAGVAFSQRVTCLLGQDADCHLVRDTKNCSGRGMAFDFSDVAGPRDFYGIGRRRLF